MGEMVRLVFTAIAAWREAAPERAKYRELRRLALEQAHDAGLIDCDRT